MEYDYIFPIKYKIYMYYIPISLDINQLIKNIDTKGIQSSYRVEENKIIEDNELTYENILMIGYEEFKNKKIEYENNNFQVEYFNIYANLKWIFEKFRFQSNEDIVILMNCYYEYYFEEEKNLRSYINESLKEIGNDFDIILNKSLEDSNNISEWIKGDLPKLAIVKRDSYEKIKNNDYNNLKIYYSNIKIYENELFYNINSYYNSIVNYIKNIF